MIMYPVACGITTVWIVSRDGEIRGERRVLYAYAPQVSTDDVECHVYVVVTDGLTTECVPFGYPPPDDDVYTCMAVHSYEDALILSEYIKETEHDHRSVAKSS